MSKEVPIYIKYKGTQDFQRQQPISDFSESSKILMYGGLGGMIASTALMIAETAGKTRAQVNAADLTPYVDSAMASLFVASVGITKDLIRFKRLIYKGKDEAHDLHRAPVFSNPSDGASEK